MWLWLRAKLKRDHVEIMVHEPFLAFGEGSMKQNLAAAVHRVMDSFDIAGPHSVAVLATTAVFRDANPPLCAAIAAAIAEADDYIAHHRGAAAEIYDASVKSHVQT